MATQNATNFQADGPAAAGFETDSASIDHGVNVQGTKCGVYGESLRIAGARVPPPPADPTGLGVCGVGDHFGVFGQGASTVGVYGESKSGVGVIGNSENERDGVGGLSDGRRPGLRGEGIGVVGATETREGIGVCGMAVGGPQERTRSPGNPFGDQKNSPPTLGDNTKGILPGTGTGVLGASGTGTGVLGVSGAG